MKFGLVVIGTVAHMGGAERQALYLVRHLSRLHDCTVEVLAFEDGQLLRPELERLGVSLHIHPYYFLWSRARRAKALAKLAWRLRHTIKPDALLPFVGIHSKAIAQVWPFSGSSFLLVEPARRGAGFARHTGRGTDSSQGFLHQFEF